MGVKNKKRLSKQEVPAQLQNQDGSAEPDVELRLNPPLVEWLRPLGLDRPRLLSRVVEELGLLSLLPSLAKEKCPKLSDDKEKGSKQSDDKEDQIGEPVVFKFKGLPSFKVHVELTGDARWPCVRSVDLHCGSDIRDHCKPDFHLPSSEMALGEAKQYWRERFIRCFMEARQKAGDSFNHPATGSLWAKHGADAMVEFLTELVIDAVLALVRDGSPERLRDLELSHLFSPEAPMAGFPKLNGEDGYLSVEQQASPPLLLGLAAGVWKAVKRRDKGLQQTLDKVRHAVGSELLKASLNAPVAYRSAKKNKLLCGPVLMFLLEQSEQDEFDQLVAKDHRSRIQALLHCGAQANARYAMFPIGAHCGLGQFPILCLAGHSKETVSFLLECQADVTRPSVQNFFPSGNPLWIAVWRGQEKMIEELLKGREAKDGMEPELALDVDSFGWYPDSSPLTVNQEAAGCNVLALAATTLGNRLVSKLISLGAQLGDCPNELSSFLVENARPLARHVADKQPQNMANGSVLQQTSGMRIEILVQEILRDDESRRKFLDAIDRACHSPGSKDYCDFMQMLSDLIGRAPAAAAKLCDESLAQPKVTDHRRYPLRASCLFQKHEQHYNAYVDTMVWNCATSFADELAPPPTNQKTLRDVLMVKESVHICGFFRTFWEVAKSIVLPDQRQALFCNISVLRTPNIINISILQAMNALPQDQLVSVFKDSAVFRAVALYVWTVLEPAYFIDVWSTFAQLVSLLVWWQNSGDSTWAAALWIGFTAVVFLDTSNLLLNFAQLQLPSRKLIIQVTIGFWMSSLTWGGRGGDQSSRSAMASSLALCLMGIIYELRLYHPLGLPLGRNLLPILKAAQTKEFVAMLILIMSILLATFLAACVEFQEFDGQLLSVAVRTWQTLIVGESSLFDVDNYEHAALRYFVVSFLFFVCNIVLMNIFISVTGAGYEEERANIVGTFSAERFRVCMESVEVTGWSRFFVLVAMVCGLCVRMMVSLALGEVWTFVAELLALLIWLVLYLLQWHFCQEVAKLRVKPEDFDPEARKYLWICVPSQRLEVDEDATDVSLNEIVTNLNELRDLLQRRPAPGRVRRMRRVQVNTHRKWLQDFLAEAELDPEKYLESALRWAETNDIVQSDLFGGPGGGVSQEEAKAHLDDLLVHLGLSDAPSRRLRWQLQQHWRPRA